MAAPTFTKYGHPLGYNQTQRRFTQSGLLGLSGTYTNGTGIPLATFNNILNFSGITVVLPPTYNGVNSPGPGTPVGAVIQSVGGYTLYYDRVNLSIRIFNGTTEVATGTIPAALTAAGIDSTFEFMKD